MPTKEELSQQINEIFGTEIKFEALTKEDLEALLKVVQEPSNLIRIGWRKLRDETKKKVVEELMGRPLLDEILKGTLEKKEEKAGEDKGPLGLGILPSIRNRVRGALTEPEKETK